MAIITMSSFLSDLKELQRLTDENMTSKTNLQKSQLMCMLMRHKVYAGFKWGIVAGWLDSNYLNMINSKNPSLFQRLSAPGTILRDSLGYSIDLPHFAAVLDGYLSNPPVKEEWTGWAGDVATMTLEVQRDTLNFQDFDLLILTAQTAIEDSNSTCSVMDICSDIDASNIAKRFEQSSASLSSIISLYYNSPLRRFSEFTRTYGDDIDFENNIYSIMNDSILYQLLKNAIRDPWQGGTPSEDQIYAVTGTFIDYIYRQRIKGL